MIDDGMLHAQLAHVLWRTNFPALGERYEGKVRDTYRSGEVRYLVATDRLSCFDAVISAIPFKGQVLTQMAAHWFRLTSDIVANHIIDVPDPNVMVGRNAEVLPIEVVVRAYLAGSAWRDYEAGRPVSGLKLPPGLKCSQQLPEVTLTPSTKAAIGAHDTPISEDEIVKRGIVPAARWGEVRTAALALFKRGQEEADRRGLILVDTKYEFGLDARGKLLLVDEIHTLDSSRYWIKSTYAERFARGESPEMLDKEPTRQWLLQRGYKGEGPVPEITADHRVAIARHYLDSFRLVTGGELAAAYGPHEARIEQALMRLGDSGKRAGQTGR